MGSVVPGYFRTARVVSERWFRGQAKLAPPTAFPAVSSHLQLRVATDTYAVTGLGMHYFSHHGVHTLVQIT